MKIHSPFLKNQKIPDATIRKTQIDVVSINSHSLIFFCKIVNTCTVRPSKHAKFYNVAFLTWRVDNENGSESNQLCQFLEKAVESESSRL